MNPAFASDEASALSDGDVLPVFRCLGYRFTIRCSDEVTERRLHEMYTACGDVAPGRAACLEVREVEQGQYEINADGERIGRAPGVNDGLELLAWYVNRCAVLASERDLLIVHAAAVARHGRAVLLVGGSGAGKSTLAAAMLTSGFAYLGDESIAIDPDEMHVIANPKPLGLDARSRAALVALTPDASWDCGLDLVPPAALGDWLAPGTTVDAVLVVQPEIDSGSVVEVQELQQIEVATLLADQSFNFAVLGAHALDIVAAVARSCPGVRLRFGDLEQARARIDLLMG